MIPLPIDDKQKAELVAYLPQEYAQSPRLDAWILGASHHVGACYFKKAYVYALSLMVAHIAALEARGSDGEAGAIASKREGDIAVSFGSTKSEGDDGWLSSTSFGQQFLLLKKQYSPRPQVTGGVPLRGFCGGHPIR